jgi:hypothetical protein
MIRKYALSLLILLLILYPEGFSQKVSLGFNNQISTAASLNFGDPAKSQLTGRYIPSLSPAFSFGKNEKLDAEISMNAFGNLNFSNLDYDTSGYRFKPYRVYLRYSNPRLELRLGLQKINFGSANILRPLMWFDKMDFRDPLQLTDGVYGFLGRYYFQNNANIWAWALYGNDKEKGWETAPTLKDHPEFGGRIQLPVPLGEVGMSYHHRLADFSKFYAGIPMLEEPRYTEDWMAVDGKMDLGVGLSFEIVQKLNDTDNAIFSKWETYYNVGLDYTFGIGNGLNLTTEFFQYVNHPDSTQVEVRNTYSVLALSYPFHLSHSLSGMVYYNWDTEEWYRFISMQLKYDYLSLYVMAFWNPDRFSLYSGPDDRTSFAGKGIQLMLVLDI